jgi:DNA-directed RNA polymerase specialized sigma24 family protein
VAIHLAFDWRRSMARQQRLLQAQDHPQAAAQEPPWLGIAQQEEAERILSVAAELGPLPQQAFVLRYVTGESYDAIAAAVGRTPHQARGLCHQAIREIRQRMQERGWLEAKPSQKAGVR